MFTVFPHLASLKRKFNTSKEIFIKTDPFQQKSAAQIGGAQQELAQPPGGLIGSEGSVSKSNMQMDQTLAGIHGIDAQSSSSHVIGLNESSKCPYVNDLKHQFLFLFSVL